MPKFWFLKLVIVNCPTWYLLAGVWCPFKLGLRVVCKETRFLGFLCVLYFSIIVVCNRYGRWYNYIATGRRAGRMSFVRRFYERQDESCLRILISRYLMDNETKFREYFRASTELFKTILTYIDGNISQEACIRVNPLISSTKNLWVPHQVSR